MFWYSPADWILICCVLLTGVDWRDVEAAAALLRQLPAAEARLAASEADLASARAALDAAAPGAAAARADADGEAARAAMKESELRRVCSALRAEVSPRLLPHLMSAARAPGYLAPP